MSRIAMKQLFNRVLVSLGIGATATEPASGQLVVAATAGGAEGIGVGDVAFCAPDNVNRINLSTNQNTITRMVSSNANAGNAAAAAMTVSQAGPVSLTAICYSPAFAAIPTLAGAAALFSTVPTPRMVVAAQGGTLDLTTDVLSAPSGTPDLQVSATHNVGVGVVPIYKFHQHAGATGPVASSLLHGTDQGPFVGCQSVAADHFALGVASAMNQNGSGAVGRFSVMANGNTNVGISDPATSPPPAAALFSVGPTGAEFQVNAAGDILTTGNLQAAQIIGVGSSQFGGPLGFFFTGPVAQQPGAALTNNVTAGGVNDVIANYTDLVIYANDAAAIRNDIYQLSRKLKEVTDALRAYGLLGP